MPSDFASVLREAALADDDRPPVPADQGPSCSSPNPAWIIDAPVATGLWGANVALALDSTGAVHTSYHPTGGNSLWYAKASTVVPWPVLQKFTSGVTWASWTSLAVDDQDRVHLVYHDVSPCQMSYYTNASGSWVRTLVGQSKAQAESLVWVAGVKIQIAYFLNDPPTTLRFLHNRGGSFVTETIGDTSGPFLGGHPVMVLDRDADLTHLLYYDASGDLTHAWAGGSGFGTSWRKNLIEAAGVTQCTQAATGGGQKCGIYPAVAWDAPRKRLQVAAWHGAQGLRHYTLSSCTANSGCMATASTIDAAVTKPAFPSLAVGPSGEVLVAYFADSLRVASLDPNTEQWSTITVDATPGTGQFSAIAIDRHPAAPRVHLLYVDPTKSLRYASRDCP